MKNKKVQFEFKISNLKNAPNREQALKCRNHLVGYLKTEADLLREAIQLLETIHSVKNHKSDYHYIYAESFSDLEKLWRTLVDNTSDLDIRLGEVGINYGRSFVSSGSGLTVYF